MYCSKCGKEILNTDKFCPFCGEIISKNTIVIDNNASIESLQKRAFLLMEENDFYSAEAYINRILSLDPENPYAHIGKAMIKNKIRFYDDFQTYYQNLFSEENFIKEDACKEEIEHVTEIINNYKIKNYLDEEEIRRQYKYDRKVPLLSVCRERQKEKITELFENDIDLYRTKKYADEKIKKLIENIFEEYDNRLENAQKTDKKKIEQASNQYSEFIHSTDEKVEKMHEEAIETKEANYQSLVESFESLSSLEEYRSARDIIFKLDGYKDSNEYLTACEKKIQEQETILSEQEKKKKLKRLIVAGVLIIMVLISSAYYIKVVVPKNKYKNAIQLAKNGKYDEAIDEFTKLGEYLDCKEQIVETNYQKAIFLYEKNEYEKAIELFDKLDEYKESEEYIIKTKYNWACSLYELKKIDDAVVLLEDLGDYNDTQEIINKISEEYVYLENFEGKSITDTQKKIKS